MDIPVYSCGLLTWKGRTVRCALGRDGVTASKVEGDMKTPLGLMILEEVYYRPDRVDPPITALPLHPLSPSDGWCDDPHDAAYNTKVRLPHTARCESLWREDHVYDVLVVLDWNRHPVRPGAGSAIFLHVARPEYAPTEGCVALALKDLVALLNDTRPGDRLRVEEGR
ncbi:MAG: hypothetical protein A2516_05435 [Alphaproteobacteria bacterium RIFOXYD12_FULL_60_8]|nr:MAG: hypothetical protein A2516_05435 [Alphaproteobacteria bacterium RIFOXYD12_FULL_60_8]